MKYFLPDWFCAWWDDKKEVVIILGGIAAYSLVCALVGAWVF